MKRVLLDMHSVLDLLLNRPPWATDAVVIWNAHRQGTIEALLAAFSVSTIYYIVRRISSVADANQAIQKILTTLAIEPVERSTLIVAMTLPGPDFEDNLQIACASQAGADAIVTRDPRGFAASPVLVLSPTDLLSRLSGQTTP
jgi:hypothetical protein